jgi:hypothetical protein
MCSCLFRGHQAKFYASLAITAKQSPFLFLTLDLPPAPLYQDELEQNIIPQVPLITILNKYSGIQAQVCIVPLYIVLDECFVNGLMNRKLKEISSATTSQDFQIISSSTSSDLLKTTGPKRKIQLLLTFLSKESICPSVSTPLRR